MNLRQTVTAGVAAALVAAVAGAFAAPAASAEDEERPTYELALDLPGKLGAGGGPAPFAVKVTRSVAVAPVDLTLGFTGPEDLSAADLAITLGDQQLTLDGENGKLWTRVGVPFGETELTKTLQLTAKLKVPNFGDGTESAAALTGKNLRSPASSLTRIPAPTDTPMPELSCADFLRKKPTRTFDALTLDAALYYRPRELNAPSAETTAASAAAPQTNAVIIRALASKSGTFAVSAPTVSLASVPATVAAGGEFRPVKITVNNSTGSAYDKSFPYFLVAKQDFTGDDADKIIVDQDGKRIAVTESPFGFYAPLGKLSLPAGQTRDAQLKVRFADDVKPGKAYLVAVLADKATADGAKQLSTNWDCKEITVTPVDDSTPTPTPTPTPSPTEATPTPSPTATPKPATQSSPLAHTGANLTAGLLGAVLLIAGTGALVATRRRKGGTGG